MDQHLIKRGAWPSLLGILLSCSPVGGQEDKAAVLKAALIANQGNLDSFPVYKCRYMVTMASAESQAAGLRGEYQNAVSCEFLQVVDGDTQKFEAVGPFDAPKKPTRREGGRLASSAAFAPGCDLSARGQSLRYFPPFQKAGVAAFLRESSIPTPLTMACADMGLKRAPTKLFLQGGSKDPVIAGKGEVGLDGRPVIHVHCKAISLDFEYYFDVSQGYLPIRLVGHHAPPWAGEKQDSIIHLLKAEEFSKDRWFPMTWLRMFVFPDRKPVGVTEVRVIELEVDKRPSKDDFSIVIPAGTSIEKEELINRGPPHTFRLRRDERIGPDDIPRLMQMLEDSSKQSEMDTAVHPSGKFAWLKWPLLGGGCILMLAASLVYRMRGRAQVS